MDLYEQRYEQACRKAFDGFEPDFSGCRDQHEARTILELARNGKRSFEIAEVIGKTPKAVQKFFRRYSFPNLHNVCPRIEQEQPMWKGGLKTTKGYLYKRMPNHPNRSKHGGYVAVHRLIMEQMIGRFLSLQEVVDHIDRDTLNNDPSNLRLFPSNAEHLRVTLAGKCPRWSEEGKKKISEAVRLRHQSARDRRASASHVELETYVHPSQQ